MEAGESAHEAAGAGEALSGGRDGGLQDSGVARLTALPWKLREWVWLGWQGATLASAPSLSTKHCPMPFLRTVVACLGKKPSICILSTIAVASTTESLGPATPYQRGREAHAP